MKQRALRPSTEKACIYCKALKPAAAFHSHRYTTRTGRQSVRLNSGCIPCHNLRIQAHKKTYRRTSRYHDQRRVYRARPAVKARLRAQLRLDRQRNPEKWSNYYLKKYGISHDEYVAMAAAQAGKCKVCEMQPAPIGRKRLLHVDHCHASGKVRGLLCHQCNVSIGLLKDNPQIVRKLLAYLEGV